MFDFFEIMVMRRRSDIFNCNCYKSTFRLFGLNVFQKRSSLRRSYTVIFHLCGLRKVFDFLRDKYLIENVFLFLPLLKSGDVKIQNESIIMNFINWFSKRRPRTFNGNFGLILILRKRIKFHINNMLSFSCIFRSENNEKNSLYYIFNRYF